MTLAETISRGSIVLLDGAMGTELAAAGLQMGGQNSLRHPEQVCAVHRSYVACGCDALISNTLTMNRVYIESHDVGVDVREVNCAGVELARSCAGEGTLVLGDMCSTGKLLEPYGTCTEAECRSAFVEQAGILAEQPIDGLIIETMIDLREALCALQACCDATDLPVLVSMAFSTLANGGRTTMGNSAAECARALADAGAAAVGVNCGELDPFETAEAVALMRSETDVPLMAQPNAGKPQLLGGRTLFDMSPARFAEGVAACIEAGATWVGGCCGTSPAHIRAVADLDAVRRGRG